MVQMGQRAIAPFDGKERRLGPRKTSKSTEEAGGRGRQRGQRAGDGDERGGSVRHGEEERRVIAGCLDAIGGKPEGRHRPMTQA